MLKSIIQVFQHGVIYEEGAEGFVARSSLFPSLAADLGLTADLRDQIVLTNFELGEGGAIVALEAGEAARKLGFQGRTHRFFDSS